MLKGRDIGVSVILVAAGESRRLRAGVRKPFIVVRGKPLVIHALEKFYPVDAVKEVILVLNHKDIAWAKRKYGADFKRLKVKRIVAGGVERRDSVRKGLAHCSPRSSLIAIHDAARPFTAIDDIERTIRSAAAGGAAILAIPATDTVKVIDNRGVVVGTPNRRELWYAQTPQIFKRKLIMSAYHLRRGDIAVTDDAELVELAGTPVRVVKGMGRNPKITFMDDIENP